MSTDLSANSRPSERYGICPGCTSESEATCYAGYVGEVECCAQARSSRIGIIPDDVASGLSTTAPERILALPERFWSKVRQRKNGCWEWLGSRTGGYGRFVLNGRRGAVNATTLAHRVCFIALIGPIPDGYDLHHLCGNRCCVNPTHCMPIEAKAHRNGHNFQGRKTSSRNRRAKVRCAQGHAYDDANTYIDPLGKRHCRVCKREALARFYDRKRSQ